MQGLFGSAGFVLAVLAASGCQVPAGVPAPSTPEPEAAADHVVARWDGGALTRAELEARLGDELARMDAAYRVSRYEKLHAALDAAVEDAVLTAAVRAGDHADVEAMLRAEVDAKLPEPTEEALQVEYARFVEEMPGTTFEAARPYLRKQLLEGRRAEHRAEHLEGLKRAAHVELDLPFPAVPRAQIPLAPHNPSMGSPDAAVTIVEYGGFECLYCRRMEPTMRRLVASYPGKVRWVIKDFPLPGHGRAEAAAVAAHCAGDQSKYWEMAEVLYRHQGRYEDGHLNEYATELGLDVPRWQACLNDPAWHERVQSDIRDGRRIGVHSTPSFFFNGLPVEGAHTYERFAALVEQELDRVAAAGSETR